MYLAIAVPEPLFCPGDGVSTENGPGCRHQATKLELLRFSSLSLDISLPINATIVPLDKLFSLRPSIVFLCISYCFGGPSSVHVVRVSHPPELGASCLPRPTSFGRVNHLRLLNCLAIFLLFLLAFLVPEICRFYLAFFSAIIDSIVNCIDVRIGR